MSFRATEKLLPCPYNRVHQILPHRMAQHIIKCRKNYPDADMKVCIFNSTHIIPTPEYQAHILECDSRCVVERELYHRHKANTLQSKQLVSEARHQVSQPQQINGCASNEDWDSEMVLSSYNPTENIIYREITRPPPPGLSKSGRRQWREREIERVELLKKGLPIDDWMCPSANEGAPKNRIEADGASGEAFRIDIEHHRKNPEFTGWKSTCSQAMQADKPLRRPKVLAESHSRIAANIFDKNTWVLNTSSSQGSDCSIEQVHQSLDITENSDQKKYMKEKQKVEKKLYEIKRLEIQRNNGCKLTQQELEKVGKRNGLETQLAKLFEDLHL